MRFCFRELEKTRKEHSEKLAQRKTEAEAAVSRPTGPGWASPLCQKYLAGVPYPDVPTIHVFRHHVDSPELTCVTLGFPSTMISHPVIKLEK